MSTDLPFRDARCPSDWPYRTRLCFQGRGEFDKAVAWLCGEFGSPYENNPRSLWTSTAFFDYGGEVQLELWFRNQDSMLHAMLVWS
jgi:hypothetical protein